MKTTRSSKTARLAWLAKGFSESTSQSEDLYWQTALRQEIQQLLAASNEKTLISTLEKLAKSAPEIHDFLVEEIEACVEAGINTQPSEQHTLLIAIPIIAWSRYTLPNNTLAPGFLNTLHQLLHDVVLDTHCCFSLTDFIFSPEQLPEGYCDLAHFTENAKTAAQANHITPFDASKLPAPQTFLSDARYVLAVVAYNPALPLFRWQNPGTPRDMVEAAWKAQAQALFAPIFPGCTIDPVLPDAFFAVNRAVDRIARHHAVGASIDFLSNALELKTQDLQAVVAQFQNGEFAELRIGFTRLNDKTVLHGVVWPFLGPENDVPEEVFVQLISCLKTYGIQHIMALREQFGAEFCDDCNAPLFPNPESEAVHTEFPEEALASSPKHLH